MKELFESLVLLLYIYHETLRQFLPTRHIKLDCVNLKSDINNVLY